MPHYFRGKNMSFKRLLLAAGLLLTATLASAATGIKVTTYIPPKAKVLMPLVRFETEKYFPEFNYPEYMPALIEHESCISLTHSRCWDPRSELNTKRERGVGLGQITKAFTATGAIRFDALTENKNKYREELSELTWNNVRERPDLQIRTLVLMTKDKYNLLYNVTNPFERLAFADAAYNGGFGGMQKERRYCGLAKGCDPQRWFGHVELKCLKSKAILYGVRSACDINRHHVSDVLTVRIPKYLHYFEQ